MSLVQRVTAIEGNDREPPPGPPLPADARHVLRYKASTIRSLRHVISYDAIPLPAADSQATHPSGGMAAYKVTTARRVGASLIEAHLENPVLIPCSPSHCHCADLLVGIWQRHTRH